MAPWLGAWVESAEARFYREGGTLYLDEWRDQQDAQRDPVTGNIARTNGLDRCACGCKYWRRDKCVDCGEMGDDDA